MVGVGATRVEVLLPSGSDAPGEPGRTQTNDSPNDSEAAAVEALTGATRAAGLLRPGARVKFAQRAQREFAAIEAAALAELKKSGASERDVTRRAQAGGTRSRKESSRLSKRADAVRENPGLADKLSDGSLGADHVDAIADAASKSGGDAAKDQKLIAEVADSKPDDAHKVTAKWLERREDGDAAQTRFDRQHQRRRATVGRDPATGNDTFTLSGPNERIREMKRAVEELADKLYHADGGRELADDRHPRNHHQRMFDAAHELLTQIAGGSASGRVGTKAPHPRTMLHVFITVDDNARQQIRAHCPDGHGYLPESVFEEYACGATIAGTVFSQCGEVLWHGRQRRYATPAQWTALIARDRACVQCGAEASRCDAHHLKPFNAPIKGETDIDDLALVCKSCHHWLHDAKQTLHRAKARAPDADAGPTGPTGRSSPQTRGMRKTTWATRPATPEETAPTGARRAR